MIGGRLVRRGGFVGKVVGISMVGQPVFEKCCKGFLACLVECNSGFFSCAFPTVIASVGSGACAARIYSATSSLSNDGSIH